MKTPDLLFETAPLPPFEGRIYPVLDSTSDEAKRLGEAGAPAGIVVIAEQQTGGRGRSDRRWASPPGNLYFSVLLRPSRHASVISQLGFVSANAVASAIRVVTSGRVSPRLKWPNDVLLDGAKIGGVLLETRIAADGSSRVEWLVIGIGVNLATAPVEGATSLLQHGCDVLPLTMAAALAKQLGAGLRSWEEQGFAPVRETWLSLAHGKGDPLRVRRPEGDHRGTFRDLDRDGTLLLDTPTGLLRVTAGDIELGA